MAETCKGHSQAEPPGRQRYYLNTWFVLPCWLVLIWEAPAGWARALGFVYRALYTVFHMTDKRTGYQWQTLLRPWFPGVGCLYEAKAVPGPCWELLSSGEVNRLHHSGHSTSVSLLLCHHRHRCSFSPISAALVGLTWPGGCLCTTVVFKLLEGKKTFLKKKSINGTSNIYNDDGWGGTEPTLPPGMSWHSAAVLERLFENQ